MKIRSNVKAGGMQLQHNEKLASIISTIEQKNSLGKKLRLNKETVRVLKDGDLRQFGGDLMISRHSCIEQCTTSCIL